MVSNLTDLIVFYLVFPLESGGEPLLQPLCCCHQEPQAKALITSKRPFCLVSVNIRNSDQHIAQTPGAANPSYCAYHPPPVSDGGGGGTLVRRGVPVGSVGSVVSLGSNASNTLGRHSRSGRPHLNWFRILDARAIGTLRDVFSGATKFLLKKSSQRSFWKTSLLLSVPVTEPSYQNESSDSVSCKPLDGFKYAFNTKYIDFYIWW